jgi:hypothetical protein
MEALCFSETLASTNESTRRQNPEEHHHQFITLNTTTVGHDLVFIIFLYLEEFHDSF